MRKSLALLTPLLFAFAALVPSSAATVNYSLTQAYVLGGSGGWDYLSYDVPTGRLFIARSTHVDVVNPFRGTVVGTIPDTPGVHGVALADNLNKGFTSNGRDNSVTVFDIRSLQTLTKISIPGKDPDAIVYDAATRHVFAMDGESNDVTVIDANTNSVVTTVPLPGGPEFAASDGHSLFVNIEDKSEIVKIDLATNTVTATWPLAPCKTPSGLAIDRDEHGGARLLSTCRSHVMAIVDARSGKVLQTLPIGAATDAAAYAHEYGFSSNGDGTLTVVHEDAPGHYAVVQNATTQAGARTMALDPVTRRAFLVTAQFGAPGTPSPSGFARRPIIPGTFTLLVMSP